MNRLHSLIISLLLGVLCLVPGCLTLISSITAPAEVAINEDFAVALDGSVIGHGGGMAALIVQIPDSFRYLGAEYITGTARRYLQRNSGIAALYQAEEGHRIIALTDSIAYSRETDVPIRVFLRFSATESGLFTMKFACGVVVEDEGKQKWQANDPPTLRSFAEMDDLRLQANVRVYYPNRNGTAAISFTGRREYLVLPDNEYFNFSMLDDFSVEFWASSVSRDVVFLSNRRDDFLTPFSLEIGIDERGEPRLSCSDGTVVVSAVGNKMIADGSWHHFAAVFRADSLSYVLTVDGREAGRIVLNEQFGRESFATAFVAARPSKTHFFRGSIDELRFWNTSRSVQEISYHRDLALSGFERSLYALYSFDNGANGRVPNLTQKEGLEAVAFNHPRLIPSTAPLRIELLSFSAVLEGDSVVMSWETFDESKVEKYEIEKRTVKGKYTVFMRVEPFRNTEHHQTYSQVDRWSGRMITYYRLRKVNLDGSILYSEDIPIGTEKILDFTLTDNDPNPFVDTTKITYTLDKRTYVSLTVYDLMGREVRKLVSEKQSPGAYFIVFDGRDLQPGMYFYKMRTSAGSLTRKMYLTR